MKSLFRIGLGIGLLVLAGCLDGDDEVLQTTATPEPTEITQPTSTTDATNADVFEISGLISNAGQQGVTVRGFVVWDDAQARLCEVLMESFPPQCGEASLTISNPDMLTVSMESAGGVRWTQGFVELTGNYDGDRFTVAVESSNAAADGSDTAAAAQDQALADAFLGFVADPSADQMANLPLADSVSLGLGEEIVKTVPAADLTDPANWTIARDEFRAWSGPFSALFLPQSAVIITVGTHLRCVADPVPAPPGFDNHRRVSLQPEEATSCLEWWTVDFFVNANGEVEAITIDLFEP